MTARVDLEPAPERALTKRSSRTAETNAVERAAETLMPSDRRLLDDPFAHHFVQRRAYKALLAIRPVALRGLRRVDQRYPGLHAEIMLRARYVDELIGAGGFEQLVMLGAGYDSTAFRHSLPAEAHIFEVDSPQTQRAKRAAIERARLEPTTPVTYCPCDFEIDSPAKVLGESRFDAARTSLTIWLGVSPYLTLEAFRGALEDAASFTASGGRLVWDYIDADVVDGTTSKEGGRRAAEWVAQRGERYLLGFTPDRAAAELDRAGFRLVEHLRTDELAARFAPPAGVWCSTDPWMGVMLAERI